MRSFRTANGLTQAAMGKMLGVTANYVGMIEAGREPSELLLKLFDHIENTHLEKSAASVSAKPALNAGLRPAFSAEQEPSALNAEGSARLCEEPATYGAQGGAGAGKTRVPSRIQQEPPALNAEGSEDDLILPAREAEPLRALARESHCNAAQLLVFAVRLYVEACRREGSIRVPIAAS